MEQRYVIQLTTDLNFPMALEILTRDRIHALPLHIFFYEFLPLIDEHNKARQNLLALELKWPTRCCWFRLMTTFIGMAVVDVQRWDRNKRRSIPSSALSQNDDGDYDDDNIGSIMMYADLIAKKLRDKTWGYRKCIQPTGRRGVHTDPDYVHPLVRY